MDASGFRPSGVLMVFWGLLVVFVRHYASVYMDPTLGTGGEV
jgi:hypothetical protein